MTTYRKKLIEVALPLEAINRESAREKSIRHGHPSTLHLWWARRPLAACRAVLFASLVDDPDSDPTLGKWPEEVLHWRRGEKRQDLFDLIEQLVKWENSNDENIIRSARAEIARCIASQKIESGELTKDQSLSHGVTPWDLVVKGHVRPIRSGKDVVGFDTTFLPASKAVNAFLAEHAPPVLDPFAGGGSIPLEAQRLGLRAYASDLNPVPVLINKALIEIPPKFAGKPPVNPAANARMKDGWIGAQGLADDIRYYGKWMRDEAEKRIGHLYPKVKITAEMAKNRPDLKPYIGNQLTAIAWLWARTAKCTNPACLADSPLLRSFIVSSKAGKRAWLEPTIDRTKKPPRVKFDVHSGEGEPPLSIKTGKGAKFKCICCGEMIPENDIRECFRKKMDGAMPLTAVVQSGRDRRFVPITEDQSRVIFSAIPKWTLDEEMNTNTPNLLSGRGYGVTHWRELFTARQMCALTTLTDLVAEAHEKVRAIASNEYASAIAIYLALCASKAVVFSNKNARWRAKETKTAPAFGRHAIPMVWDFAEVNPFGGAGGDFYGVFDGGASAIEKLPAGAIGEVKQLDATKSLLVQHPIVSTDPPYYDNIAYADLSDFFYIWLRHSLRAVEPQLLATVMTPKAQELVAAAERFDGDADAAKRFFEAGLEKVFRNVAKHVHGDFPTTVFYAFKQTETDDNDDDDEGGTRQIASTGWETMLEALMTSGFLISGTWPTRTEGSTRMIAMETNSLASSIVLVCRPRPSDASMATRREFLDALKRELPVALSHLQRGNIAPVDLAQAAIGPGMAVFSRYAKVMEADGSPMSVRQALSLINQTLDEVLAEQEGEFDTDTRWAVSWFEQFGMDEGAFGMAETLSKAKNTAVNGLEEAGIIRAKSGKVRLLKREELSADWDPATDNRVSAWEVTQYLIYALETGGETAAATLLRKLGGLGESARDLAYRLFHICERKGFAAEAISYNGLVIAWPELSRLARATPSSEPAQKQSEMF